MAINDNKGSTVANVLLLLQLLIHCALLLLHFILVRFLFSFAFFGGVLGADPKCQLL